MKTLKIIILISTIFFLAVPVFSQTAADESKILSEYEQLKKDYDMLLKDRDNLRAQAKFLVKYKNEIAEAQKTLSDIEQERSQWDMERETLKATNRKLQNQLALLQTQIENLGITQVQLEEERDNFKKTLSKSKAGYIIIDDLKRQINDHKRENQRLNDVIQRLKDNILRLENSLAKAETNIDVTRNQLSELKNKYNDALQANNVLERKLEYLPKEYAEVARENKVLLKRTALMHYNLGVFYTKNKEYPRAIAEFEKTIELNPEDASAYFNLGYIYAEYLVDRPKAIENFSTYLKLAKKDDKDIDWVKRYILTWQTWEGKNKSK